MAINLTITEENEPPISVTITEGIGVTTGGGSTTVIDNLTSTSATSALSANQGRVLDEGKAAIDHNHDGEYDPAGSAATVASNLSSHTGNTSNPHSVTKAQVGLSNVENTALSTWTGNTSITSLGTISVGTWQGTSIADAYIASASTWNAKYDEGDLELYLSTWEGDTSIATVGTIGSGTWQGAAIGDTYISSAATWNAKATSAQGALADSAVQPSSGSLTIWRGTEAAYTALGSYDANTLYIQTS